MEKYEKIIIILAVYILVISGVRVAMEERSMPDYVPSNDYGNDTSVLVEPQRDPYTGMPYGKVNPTYDAVNNMITVWYFPGTPGFDGYPEGVYPVGYYPVGMDNAVPEWKDMTADPIPNPSVFPYPMPGEKVINYYEREPVFI